MNAWFMKKFASQMDGEVLEELRSYSKETGVSLSRVLTEAVREYLSRARVRPAFRSAADEVMEGHAELLGRLAK